jgi:hypothetical protein
MERVEILLADVHGALADASKVSTDVWLCGCTCMKLNTALFDMSMQWQV